jgi:hypothetical protein
VSGFRDAVVATPALNSAFNSGLQALDRGHRTSIDHEGVRLEGSVAVDDALKKLHPTDARVDYAVAFKPRGKSAPTRVDWIEFHPATEGDVKKVERKFDWLDAWLGGEGKALAKFDKRKVWIAVGSGRMSPTSRDRRRIAQAGIVFAGTKARAHSLS